LTTFAAFVVTALSPITNIKVFGIFAALLVATNFLLCCLLTPILITLVHQNKCCPCCFKEKKINHEGKNQKKKKEDDGMKEDPEKQTENKEENQNNSIELRLVERFFHDTLTPCVLRYQWLVVLLGIVLIVVVRIREKKCLKHVLISVENNSLFNKQGCNYCEFFCCFSLFIVFVFLVKYLFKN